MEGLLDSFWEAVHPQLDPDDGNDPTGRVNILSALCDADLIVRPLRETPLVSARGLGQYNLRDYEVATGKAQAAADANPAPISAIDAAFLDVEPEQLRETANALEKSVASVARIEALLTEKAGVHHAIDVRPLGDPLKAAQQVVREYLGRRFPDEIPADEETETDTAVAGGRQARLSGSITNREDVMRALDKVCEYLNKYEPTSPAQLFIECAKRLMTTNFIDSVKILGTDGVALLEKVRKESSE
jgi:type VI secretion system protein ImpA